MKPLSQARCLITGTTSGLGYELALSLLGSGAEVILHGRTAESVAGVAQRLGAAIPGARIVAVHADLGESDCVSKLIDQLPGAKIDLLINNAGAAFPAFALNVRGVERTTWINHFVPLMLTKAMLPRMAPDGLVAAVSSTAAAFVALDEAAPDIAGQGLAPDYTQLRTYGLSKLLSLCAMNALGRAQTGGPTIISVDPGGIQTDFARKAGEKAFLDMTLEHWDDCVTAAEAARQVLEAVGRSDLVQGARYYDGQQVDMPESARDAPFADRILSLTETFIAGF
jgi:NAD(P)-dependent dehydrogenase (short-subunit alcohol dehydrogenase family)